MVPQRHPLYNYYYPQWQRCQDAFAGADQVKLRREYYLPRLSSKMQEGSYNDYLLAADWYDYTEHTVRSLAGAVVKEPPVAMGIDQEWIDDLTLIGDSLSDAVANAIEQHLVTGRGAFWADYSKGRERPYLVYFPAEHILSWSMSRDGMLNTVWIYRCFYEEQEGEKGLQSQNYLYKLFLDMDASMDGEQDAPRQPRYMWTRYKAKERKVQRSQTLQIAYGAIRLPDWLSDEYEEEETLSVADPAQEPLDHLPFHFVGPINPVKPPLLGAFDTTYSLYRNSALLERSLPACSAPFLFWTSDNHDQQGEQSVFPGAIIKGEQDDTITSVSPDGMSLEALMTTMKEKVEAIRQQSTTLIAEVGIEQTATEIAALSAARTAGLQLVVQQTEDPLQKALQDMVRIAGGNPDAVSLEINRDFLREVPSEIISEEGTGQEIGEETEETEET